MNKKLLFVLFFLVIVLGCKKSDEDQNAPTIQVFSPIANQHFNVGDTITVSALVKDDINLDLIKISVYDSNKNIEMLPSANFSNNGKEKQIYCTMALNNIFMESGTYYLAVFASDGTNVKNYFVPIFVSGLPRKLLGLIYVSALTNNTVEIKQIDTLQNDVLILSLNGDYSASELSSKYQKLFIAGSINGNLSAINLTDNSIQWSKPNLSNNGLPWFYQLYFSNNLLYASTHDGLISGYTINGLKSKVYTLPVSWHGVEFLETERRFIAQVEDVPTVKPQLAMYYNSSATFISIQESQFDIVKLFSYNADKVMAFTNKTGVGTIYEFNFLLNSFTTLTGVFGQKIIDVVQLSQEQFLVLTDQQVYLYRHDQGIGLTSLNTSTGNQLLYDALTNCYFVVKSQQIDRYSFPEGIFINTIHTSYPISKAHLFYNR